jgi:L-ornithine N5-oxygenase
MNTSAPRHTDVLGIGFGPAQLALAHAAADASIAHRIEFVEASDGFAWHPGMLLDGATMQVNFTKDLVTPRRPTHPASFLNFLHAEGRLAAFMNLKTLYPTRTEFSDYLRWAAALVPSSVHYGCRVDRIRWDAEDQLFVVSAGERRWTAQHLVIGVGLQAVLPDGIVASRRVWHSERLLPSLDAVSPERLDHVVVVGSGQSAAEAAKHLLTQHPHIRVTAILQSYGYAPADDSPFVNRMFDPGAVDEFFDSSEDARRRVLDVHRNTNYSVVDAELIDELARIQYEDRSRGAGRFELRNLTTVLSAVERDGVVHIETRDLRTGERRRETVDVVIAATGYRPTPVAPLFEDPGRIFSVIRDGVPETDRSYRACVDDAVTGSVWVHGGEEATHGLSSSLLSNIAVRGGEIVDELANVLNGQHVPVSESAGVSA